VDFSKPSRLVYNFSAEQRRSTIQLEGIIINMLLIIEIIDEKSKLEPLLPNLKMMVDDNGLIAIPVDIV